MARAFRRHLAEHGVRPDADLKVLRDAIAHIEQRKAAAMAAQSVILPRKAALAQSGQRFPLRQTRDVCVQIILKPELGSAERKVRRTDAQPPLHQDSIDPLTQFEADIAKRAYRLKACILVQGN